MAANPTQEQGGNDGGVMDARLRQVENAIISINETLKHIAATMATKADLAEMKTELKTDLAELRTEFKTDLAELKIELKTDIAGVKIEVSTMSYDLLRWLMGTILASVGLAIAAIKLLP